MKHWIKLNQTSRDTTKWQMTSYCGGCRSTLQALRNKFRRNLNKKRLFYEWKCIWKCRLQMSAILPKPQCDLLIFTFICVPTRLSSMTRPFRQRFGHTAHLSGEWKPWWRHNKPASYVACVSLARCSRLQATRALVRPNHHARITKYPLIGDVLFWEKIY